MEKELVWIKEAQSGDKVAFRKLVETYQRRLFAFCYDLTGSAADAEDLSQEVFVKMWKGLSSFRTEAKLSSWLYRIAMNTWIDWGRRKNAKLDSAKNELEEGSLTDHNGQSFYQLWGPERSTENSILQEELKTALDSLSAKERAVFSLRHFEDLKLGTIGERLGITTGTVKSHLFRAVQKLQVQLSPLLQEQV